MGGRDGAEVIDLSERTVTPGFIDTRVHLAMDAAEACKEAIRCGARRLEYAYPIDEEAVDMAMRAGAYIVPTMQITQEDLGELRAGTLPCHVVWKVQGACAEIGAMPGNATDDFAATADADFVMRAGVVHRRPGADGGGG